MARYIHRIKWSCVFCGDEAGIFSNEELLIRLLTQNHVETHPPTLDAFDLSKAKLKGRIASPVPANHCPLCGPPTWHTPEKSSKDAERLGDSPEDLHLHFIGHLQHLALLSISWWDEDVGAAIDFSDSSHGSADAIGLNSEIDGDQPQGASSLLHLEVKEHNVIAFDMGEYRSHGKFPAVIIKRVCDYADGHNNEAWQPFAAATAAAAARAFLAQYSPVPRPVAPSIDDIKPDSDPRDDKMSID
ncbi:hypothetical protein GGI43DRAFT_384269 [Trichoderma evansii]